DEKQVANVKELIVDIVEEIKNIPKHIFERFVDNASAWMEKNLKFFDEKQKSKLWHIMIDALEYRDEEKKEQNMDGDYVNQAINRAEGRLTWMVFAGWQQRGKGEGFEENIAPFMDRLVQLQNYSGSLIRCIMIRNLHYLYFIAPDWTEKNIISYLQEDKPTRWIVWDGYRYRPEYLPQADLFRKMRPAILDVFHTPEQKTDADLDESYKVKNDLIMLLVLILLYREKEDYNITPQEIRQLLRKIDDEARRFIIGDLRVNIRKRPEKEKEQKAQYFFEKIWPLDAKFLTEDILSEIIFFVVDMKYAFPECLKAVKDFLRPIKLPYPAHYSKKEKPHLAEEFPEEMLELLYLTINDQTPLFYAFEAINNMLDDIRQAKPELANDSRFQKLQHLVDKTQRDLS
ncbi:MAG: hypothetical protein OXT03_00035, partial [Alphaproteobacteria bacterium]|nr:hypothetical protein [Alphaproteobacteria bacterium]